VGPFVALGTLDAREPVAGLARGLGVLLLGAAGGQVVFFLPEARQAWTRGPRLGVALLSTLALLGAGLLYWGLTD